MMLAIATAAVTEDGPDTEEIAMRRIPAPTIPARCSTHLTDHLADLEGAQVREAAA